MTHEEIEQLSDEEILGRAQVFWPVCKAILTDAIHNIHSEMEKTIDTESAYNLVHLLLLSEVFWRRTVQICANRAGDDDIIVWIERIYDDWENDMNFSGKE
jgi:hypothetical protein